MLDPSKRFLTLILVASTAVLLLAIIIGEHMGNSVLGSTERRADAVPQIVITPAPNQTTGPFGPDWKRSQTLSAAPDPGFPDPRVPPQPLPTRLPRATPAPKATATYNPSIPIWRQKPLPTINPQAPVPGSTETPVPGPSIPPQ